MPAEYLTLDEATREYEVSQATLYRWLATGKLKRYKRGGDRRTLVLRAELARLTEIREKE